MDNNNYGGNDYGSGYGNSDYGSSGTGNNSYGSSDYGTSSAGNSSYGSSDYGNTDYGTGSAGNTSSRPRESYYQDDIAYTGGQNSNQNTYGGQGQYGGGQYNSQNQYGGGQYSGQPQQFYNQQSFYEEPMTVGQWMLTILILFIPCVSVVMVLIWAFGNGENETKRNFARAILVYKAIQIVFVFLFAILVVAAGDAYRY